ncbi:MAG: precorrin-6Y C5,15-methyltransferase (decarboxylating) subunit CbiT [Pseudomonadota bacterium]
MTEASSTPWLTIIGMGEDGPAGLCPASREALAGAEVVTGAARLMALLDDSSVAAGADRRVWPVPFAEGIAPLLALRGRRVAVLASGDPFWCGAGTTLSRHLPRGEWRALPGRSTFSLAAARMGWALEETLCLGLHAAPFERLRPRLAPGLRALLLLRNGAAPGALAAWLTAEGFGPSRLWVLEALGGPAERVRLQQADGFGLNDVAHPVAVALEVAGTGRSLPRTSGLPDEAFEHDGQITKRAVRAVTLSTLAPRAGERLWDIGAGSGSIAIEWLLAAERCEAVAIEQNPERAARIQRNADHFGLRGLTVVKGAVPAALESLAPPDAVFIGGGLSEGLLEALWAGLQPGTRIVANAVTLESEALLTQWYGRVGGGLTRLALSTAAPLGGLTGWRAAYPVVQWSVIR